MYNAMWGRRKLGQPTVGIVGLSLWVVTKANPCNKIPRGDDDECRSSEVIDTKLPGKATKR